MQAHSASERSVSGMLFSCPVGYRVTASVPLFGRFLTGSSPPPTLPGGSLRFPEGRMYSPLSFRPSSVGCFFVSAQCASHTGWSTVAGRGTGPEPSPNNLRYQEHRSNPRGCYELAQEWLTNAENWGPTENRTNREIRIGMGIFSRVHNTVNRI